MIFYEIRVCHVSGNEMTVCVAARSHQEAVDVLIAERAQGVTGAFERYLTCAEANALFDDLEWLELHHEQGSRAWEVTVYELGMPFVPGIAFNNGCKTIGLDIMGSLKVQGLIEPDFVLGCRDD